MKRSHIIGLVLIATAIAAILSTYADSSTYGDFKMAKASESEIHVVGKLLKDREMVYDPIQDANYFSFFLIDNAGNECKVVFSGTKPQDFERSEQIVITGKMEGDVFQADKILMKCPSKYTQDQIETKEFKAS
jgi:cytochrome c-type biogenesis protein CcmE